MLYLRENYVHNKITFTDEEKKTLKQARNILTMLYDMNTQDSMREDVYLTELCKELCGGIKELTEDYSNVYIRNEE